MFLDIFDDHIFFKKDGKVIDHVSNIPLNIIVKPSLAYIIAIISNTIYILN